MRTRWILLALVALVASTAYTSGQVKSKPSLLTVQSASGSGGSVSITFVQIGAPVAQPGANQATIDLGQVSYLRGSSQPGVTSRALPGVLQLSTDFGIRVDRQGNAAKTANVSAFLLAGTSTVPVSIDGLQLRSSGQVITANASFGIVVPHTLLVAIPTSAPAGPLSLSVGIMASVN